MLQLIPTETEENAEYYNQCLNTVRAVLMEDQDEAVNYRAVTRIGKYVLLPIDDYYHVFGGMETDTERLNDTVKILRAKLRYLLWLEINNTDQEIHFSLYPISQKLEAYYLQNGFLAMKIGPYALTAYNRYKSLSSKL